MISKELLSEVLNKKVIDDDISNIELKENTITFIEDYWDEDEGSGFYRSHTINVYELANKCKEYAMSKGYYLRAEQGVNYKDNLQWTAFLNTNMDDGADYVDYWNSTEPEAIFKAAQWVLDNTSTNKLKGH